MDPQPSSNLARVQNAINAFMHHESTAPDDITALESFLEARPTRQNAVDFFIDEVETRIDLAGQLVSELTRKVNGACFTPLLWSIIMVIPMEILKELSTDAATAALVVTSTDHLEVLLKTCKLKSFPSFVVIAKANHGHVHF